jgi:hypothetical protein
LEDKIKKNTAQGDLQIKSEQHNLVILEFFLSSKTSFWNKNEVTLKAGGSIFAGGDYSKSSTTTLNFNRVSKTIDFFYKQKMLINFSDLEYAEQKKEKRSSTKEISSNSYRVTPKGEKTYQKIIASCLNPTSKGILGLK